MDIGFNLQGWTSEQAGGGDPRLDWRGLRARFLAGYALRGAQGVAQGGAESRRLSGGSFNRESARILSGYGQGHTVSRPASPETRLASVNQTALGDGNAPGGKNQPVAGKKRPAFED